MIMMKTSWDLTHLYKNDDEWNDSCKKFLFKVKKLEKMQSSLLESIENLYEFLKLNIVVDELIEQIYCYPKRHLDIDLTLTKYQEMFQKALDLYGKIQIINSNFEKEIISNYDLAEDYLKDSKLSKYYRYLYLILRRRDHIIADDTSDIYSKYIENDQKMKAEYRALFNNEIVFKTVDINGNTIEINRNNYNDLILDKNQKNRKIIFDTYTDAYAKANDILAELYIKKLKNDITVSKLEKYDSLLSKKLFELELPNSIIDNLINTVNHNLSVMHNYTAFKKDVLELSDFHVYDASVSICEIPKMELNLDESLEIIKNINFFLFILTIFKHIFIN